MPILLTLYPTNLKINLDALVALLMPAQKDRQNSWGSQFAPGL